jgi:ketosteroid isomerase-like protein
VIDESAWLAAWGDPDLDRIRELSADDLEVVAVTASIEPRHYSGREAAVRWLTDLRQRLKASWSADRLTQFADDAIVVEGTLYFNDPSATGAETQRFAVLMRLRAGRVTWIGTFPTLDAARDAWERGIAGSA